MAEANVQEMLLELMKEIRGQSQEMRDQFHKIEQQFQDIKAEKEKDRKEFQDMGKQIEQKFESLQSEIKQDLKVEFQKVRGEIPEEISETLPSEIEVLTNSKISSAKKRSIRKVRILKSRGIRISKFRKRQEKATRLGRVKMSRDCHLTKYKRSSLTKHKYVIYPSEVKGRSKVFQNVPSKVKTKVKISKEIVFLKVKLKKTSEKHKKQITGVNLTRRLGEQPCTNCHKGNENLNFQSDEFDEKLKNCQIVNGHSRHKFSVEKPSQNCTNCLKLQSVFQTGTKITNGFSKSGTKWPNISKNRMRDKRVLFKMKNWTKSRSNRASDSKVSFKMKKKDEIVKFRKTNVKMKVMFKQGKFGKPKWKFKVGI
jgi:hypothetical protein